VLQTGDDASEIAREADADALGIAGGDGSLAAVAAVAAEGDLPFVCVPFGTRNHFAGDVGVDVRDPVAALDAFSAGIERRIDIGWANGRPFVNNVSLGVYAGLVHRREGHRRRRDAFARIRSLAVVVRDRHGIGLTVDGSPVHARVVLVSNNAYELSVLSIGKRARLDEGLLHLYVPLGLLRTQWDERAAPRFVVGARTNRVRAAVDGEPETFTSPIEFRVAPGALRVLLPRVEQ